MYGAKRGGTASQQLRESVDGALDAVSLVVGEALESRGKPCRPLLPDGLQHLVAFARQEELDTPAVGRAAPLDQVRGFEPDEMAGHAWRRDALALGKLPGGDARLVLDRDEQRHLAARHAERVDLPAELARQAQYDRAELVCRRDRIVKHTNH